MSDVYYVIVGNLDGKQARRTSGSSPLGPLFDHCLDATPVLPYTPIVVAMLTVTSAQRSERTFVSRSSPYIPRLTATSGMQDERDFRDRGRERGVVSRRCFQSDVGIARHGPVRGECRLLERSRCSVLPTWEVCSQVKARTETQQKVESTARAHGMPVELPAGSWRNLMKAFQDQYGSSIPPKELPAQSYFEVLEEMVQDRVFYAESLAQVVSLDTENKRRPANPDTHSQHIATLFDGSTIRPKRRLVSSMPDDLESFRTKYEIIANAWRMIKLRSPGRAVLVGLTENTWDTHRRWLMDSKRFAMELEVAPGVMKAPRWHLCLSY